MQIYAMWEGEEELKELLEQYLKGKKPHQDDFTDSEAEEVVFGYFNTFAAATPDCKLYLQSKWKRNGLYRGNIQRISTLLRGTGAERRYTVGSKVLADWVVPALRVWRKRKGFDELTGKSLESVMDREDCGGSNLKSE